jgi:hypothetical protein
LDLFNLDTGDTQLRHFNNVGMYFMRVLPCVFMETELPAIFGDDPETFENLKDLDSAMVCFGDLYMPS